MLQKLTFKICWITIDWRSKWYQKHPEELWESNSYLY